MNIQDAIKHLCDLREMASIARKDLKEIDKDIAAQEIVVRELMEAQGIESTRVTGYATITLTEETVYNVEDRDAWFAFLLDTRQTEYASIRPSNRAIREAVDLGFEVPGLVPFVKKKLSVTKPR